MFLDILEFRIENKKYFRENCFENVVSDLWKKKSLYVHKSDFRRKVQKLKTTKN